MTLSPSRSRRTATSPPVGVNLTALDRRFQMTCCKRSASPDTGPADGSSDEMITIFLASAAGRPITLASSTIGTRSPMLTSMRSCPVIMRDTSSSSPISLFCALALLFMTSSARANLSSPSRLPLSIFDHPRMELSGERSSCETVARNSSLRRLACSDSARAADSCSYAARISSSARLRSVTSRAILDAPMTSPRASLIGDRVSEISTSLPSLRRHGLEVLDVLAAPHALHDIFLRFRASRRIQHRDRPANSLLGCVTVEMFRPFIPTCDDAIEVYGDDGVVRRLDDGGQPGNGQFRLSARGHVFDAEEDAPRASIPIVQPAGVEQHVSLSDARKLMRDFE